MSIDKISVIGLGYIGLPTAAVIASRKKKVIGVDISKYVVDTINKGQIHIIEPDLDIVVHSAVVGGFLHATSTPEPADAFMIAVPTPFNDDHQPGLQYIEFACKAIAPVLSKGNLVILESTSPVGTTDLLAAWLAEARPDLTFPQQCGEDSDIRIAHCPERVLPGHVLRELVENDRVIGGMTKKCSQIASTLYKIFVNGNCIITDARTAEMCKLTENSFRDVNIAFANELSIICDKLDIDVWELIDLANRHPRVNILQPGPGVGGHCIAVDPWFIVSKTPDQARIIRTAREVNDSKPFWVIEKISSAANSHKDSLIGCLGLTFKANIDDIRESPALDIVNKLRCMYPDRVMACDPNCNEITVGFPLFDLNDVISKANILVLLVDHTEFISLDKNLLRDKVIIDTRGAIH